MECGPLLRLLDRDPAVKRLGVGRERIRLQSAMRPEVELQLGGRTGSAEGKADRSEPVLPLRSVLRAEASLYSLFIPDLAARGECRLWPRPPSPSPKRLDHLSERLRESVCAFLGRLFAERERADRAQNEIFFLRTSSAALFHLLVAEF